MNLNVFTLVHILISLTGILAGLVVVGGWLSGREHARLTTLFLATTLATSVTGFFFPFNGFTPAHAFGVLSIVLLAVAGYALYLARLAGIWRRVYAITALTTLYLNFFVLIAQLFQKTPALQQLAPKQAEPPFALAQGLLLIFFIALGVAAVRQYQAAGSGARS